MLMKFLKLFAIILFVSGTTQVTTAQDALPPTYLTTQSFPDSVLNLSLLTFNNEKKTFAKILAEHKGKKIFVDLWASWCRDCIVGYPKVEELLNTVDTTKVDFIFISVDKDDTKWRNAIDKFKINGGTHYRSETAWYNTLTNYIVLDWIPRYIVIDEQGRIVLPKAVHAEDPGVKKVLVE